MPRTKQKKNKNVVIKRRTLAIATTAVLLVFSILITVIYFSQKSKLNSDPRKNDLQNPAVMEAKSIADKYFEAVSNCDLETANSLRLLPKNITKTKEECQKECPGGLVYKYLKPVSYNSQESGGITGEVAAFDYAVNCGDKTTPILLQMIRTSDDNRWQVLGTM